MSTAPVQSDRFKVDTSRPRSRMKMRSKIRHVLAVAAGMPQMALFRHLRVLQAGQVVRKTKGDWELAPNAHPLARAFGALLDD